MINYVYPTSKELRVINAEKIPNLERERPTFAIFKTTTSNDWTLEWEQKDGYRGMQQLRGLNGEPSYVKMQGFKRFSAKPGVYGEYMTVDEEMMTMRASQNGGDEGRPINIDDLVTERQDTLNVRETDLIEFIHWSCLLQGQFLFVGPTGAIYGDQFNIQTTTFSDWSDLVNATPIKDLLGLKTLQSGKSVSFGTGSIYFMNSKMVGYLMLNRNPNDLGGQMAIAQGGVKPVKTLGEVNSMLQGFGLGTIVEYDEDYTTDAGVVTKWIPDDVVSIVGRRSNGDDLGEYRMVRNANNPNLEPGRYEKVIDHVDRRVPRTIEVHRGHNGGLVLFYGSAIVRANA